jgi:hypothetical protein
MWEYIKSDFNYKTKFKNKDFIIKYFAFIQLKIQLNCHTEFISGFFVKKKNLKNSLIKDLK